MRIKILAGLVAIISLILIVHYYQRYQCKTRANKRETNMEQGKPEKYLQQCEEGNLESCYYAGDFLRKNKKDDEAYKLLQRSCNDAHGPFDPRACETLGDRELGLGKKEQAKRYYELAGMRYTHLQEAGTKLGNLLKEEGKAKEACLWYFKNCKRGSVDSCIASQDCPDEIIPDEPSGAGADCASGEDAKCKLLAEHYKKYHDDEKALSYYKIPCDRGQTEFACYEYLQLLLYLKRWAESKELVNKLCAKEKAACVRLGDIAALEGDSGEALRIFGDLCTKERIPKACNQMRTEVLRTMKPDEQKDYYRKMCETKNEESSCVALAMRFHKEDNVAKRDKYLKLGLELIGKRCQEGSPDYCIGHAMLQCATGDVEAGGEAIRKLCEQNERYCSKKFNCKEAFKKIEQKLSEEEKYASMPR